MSKKDEDKMVFHTDEVVFCYTKMPFELKNARATYQRLADTIFKGQIERNLEANMDDMVIKSKTEQDLIEDVKETLPLRRAAERVIPCLDTLKKCTNKNNFGWTEAAKEAFQAMKWLIAELPTLTAPMKDEELMVYLTVANEAVSVVLLVESNGWQIPIHYVLFRANEYKDSVTGDDSAIGRTPSSKVTVDPKVVPESSKGRNEQASLDPMAEADTWKLYIA
nr:hypothetical protein [Tanacetum cinerariifolium]